MIIHYIRKQIQHAFEFLPCTTISIAVLLLSGFAFYSLNLFDGIYQKDVSSSSRQTLGKAAAAKAWIAEKWARSPFTGKERMREAAAEGGEGEMQVFVRQDGGEVRAVEVPANATVGDLRVHGNLEQTDELSFAGAVLGDEAALADIGIGSESVINVVRIGNYKFRVEYEFNVTLDVTLWQHETVDELRHQIMMNHESIYGKVPPGCKVQMFMNGPEGVIFVDDYGKSLSDIDGKYKLKPGDHEYNVIHYVIMSAEGTLLR